ncbi:MAG: hypothetical protein JST00_18875 [Deltaproteobacteria bacterium]|nr:hypothetical protein [Deltaproteobacteria bacterium]
MRPSLLSLALVTLVGAAAPLAACGETPPPQVPTPNVPPSGSASSTAPTPSTPGTSPAGTGSGSTATTPPPAKGAMKAIMPSAMAADLKALGLDPKALPPLSKVPPDKMRPLMMTFKKALGVECTGCHDAGNFKAPTPKKKIAAKMWDQFTRSLAMEDAGSVLYCDSCHQGSMEFLDTHDKKALSAWMDANFVSKLKRVDKKDHSCETCHGDPFEPKFVHAWGK